MRTIFGAAAIAAAMQFPASAYYIPGWEYVPPQVLTGVLTEWGDSYLDGLEISAPGTYRLSWSLDRPLEMTDAGELEQVSIMYTIGWVADWYEYGEWVGGLSDSADSYIVTTATYGHVNIQIPEAYVAGDYEFTEIYWEYIRAFGIIAQDLNEPLGFTLTLVQVPEPATWAMFIAGFGIVGFAIRRKHLLVS